MRRILVELREKLKAEGAYDNQRSFPQPTSFKRVAVISPPDSAGEMDFRHGGADRLESESHCNFEYFPLKFISEHGIDETIEALQNVNKANREKPFDAVILFRAGFSFLELKRLNNYEICNAILKMPLPVLVAIPCVYIEPQSFILAEIANMTFRTPVEAIMYIIGLSTNNTKGSTTGNASPTENNANLIQSEIINNNVNDIVNCPRCGGKTTQNMMSFNCCPDCNKEIFSKPSFRHLPGAGLWEYCDGLEYEGYLDCLEYDDGTGDYEDDDGYHPKYYDPMEQLSIELSIERAMENDIAAYEVIMAAQPRYDAHCDIEWREWAIANDQIDIFVYASCDEDWADSIDTADYPDISAYTEAETSDPICWDFLLYDDEWWSDTGDDDSGTCHYLEWLEETCSEAGDHTEDDDYLDWLSQNEDYLDGDVCWVEDSRVEQKESSKHQIAEASTYDAAALDIYKPHISPNSPIYKNKIDRSDHCPTWVVRN